MHVYILVYKIYVFAYLLIFGSPVKAENIPSKRRPQSDDPRTVEFRNQPDFEDCVRSSVINGI